jgi:hypothetical protein
MKTNVTPNALIHGNVAPGFEAVQAEFARNFTGRGLHHVLSWRESSGSVGRLS